MFHVFSVMGALISMRGIILVGRGDGQEEWNDGIALDASRCHGVR